MKKFILGLGLIGLAFGFSNVYADGTSGCGLGAQIWKGQKGLIPHTSAATTNASSYTQLLGMTSGTSDCDISRSVEAKHEKKVFVASNFEMLSEEASKGSGEFLAAYGHLFGCAQDSLDTFGGQLQGHYGEIFIESKNAIQVVDKTKEVIAGDATLAKNCSAL